MVLFERGKSSVAVVPFDPAEPLPLFELPLLLCAGVFNTVYGMLGAGVVLVSIARGLLVAVV